ncbi:MAG TPA: hypothetical protein VI653_15800 [Steroidobacteraceae bacterium]
MVNHEGNAQYLTEVEADVYRLTVVNRLSQRVIGERLGISQQQVSVMLAKAREKLPPVDLEAIRRESLELHYDTKRRALELAERLGAPVTAGKDGDLVLDPQTNEYVRDYSLRLAALDTARKADIEIRKLLGADSATKIETSGTIRYEVASVDLDALS